MKLVDVLQKLGYQILDVDEDSGKFVAKSRTGKKVQYLILKNVDCPDKSPSGFVSDYVIYDDGTIFNIKEQKVYHQFDESKLFIREDLYDQVVPILKQKIEADEVLPAIYKVTLHQFLPANTYSEMLERLNRKSLSFAMAITKALNKWLEEEFVMDNQNNTSISVIN